MAWVGRLQGLSQDVLGFMKLLDQVHSNTVHELLRMGPTPPPQEARPDQLVLPLDPMASVDDWTTWPRGEQAQSEGATPPQQRPAEEDEESDGEDEQPSVRIPAKRKKRASKTERKRRRRTKEIEQGLRPPLSETHTHQEGATM